MWGEKYVFNSNSLHHFSLFTGFEDVAELVERIEKEGGRLVAIAKTGGETRVANYDVIWRGGPPGEPIVNYSGVVYKEGPKNTWKKVKG